MISLEKRGKGRFVAGVALSRAIVRERFLGFASK
jgi:hypothetical protein